MENNSPEASKAIQDLFNEHLLTDEYLATHDYNPETYYEGQARYVAREAGTEDTFITPEELRTQGHDPVNYYKAQAVFRISNQAKQPKRKR